MDIMLAHLLIKLLYALCFYDIFLSVVFTLHFPLYLGLRY